MVAIQMNFLTNPLPENFVILILSLPTLRKFGMEHVVEVFFELNS